MINVLNSNNCLRNNCFVPKLYSIEPRPRPPFEFRTGGRKREKARTHWRNHIPFFHWANLNEAIIVKGNHQKFILYSLSPVQEKNSPVLNNGEPPLSRAYCVQSLVETTTVVLKKMSFGAYSHWAVHEGFLACQTYEDICLKVISEGPWPPQLLPSIWQYYHEPYSS